MTSVGVETVGGAPALVYTRVQYASPPEQPVDQVSITAYRHPPGEGAWVPLDDTEVPLFATIAGAYPTAAEADAARSKQGCRTLWRVSSDAYPRLTPGRVLLAWIDASKAGADGQLDRAKACAPDAYVKPAR